MFLNVRLMVAAVAASVAVLICGFGLFAAFRVSHEPLSRLAAGAPPLTLAVDGMAPAAPNAPAGTPFDARFQLPPSQVAAGAAAPADTAVAPAGSGLENNAAPQAASDTAATNNADNAPAQAAPPAQTATTEPDAGTELAAKPDDAVAAVPNTAPDAPDAPAAPGTVAAEAPASPPESVPSVQQANQDAAPETTATTPPATAASEPPPSEPSPPDAQAGGQANQETKPETTDKPAAEPAPKKPHHKARRTKLAAKPPVPRGARPAVAATGTQPAYAQPFAMQPTYTRAFGTENSGVGGPFVPVVAKKRPAPHKAAVAAKPQTP